MPSSQGIGENEVVPFSYTGTGAYQVIALGFAPSWVMASASTYTWIWNSSLSSGQAISIFRTASSGSSQTLANVNGAGQVDNVSGYGVGIFVGTSTHTNANSLTFNGIAVR